MKKYNIRTIRIGFIDWITTLGYSEGTIFNCDLITKEFFKYIETLNIDSINDIKALEIKNYVHSIKTRPNKRRGGGLTVPSVNKQIYVLRKLREYILHVYQITFPIYEQYERHDKTEQVYLSVEEIESLFSATDETVMGSRDRAMLALYYGCGLRRSEGIKLSVKDVNLNDRTVVVRSPKNKIERIVPLASSMCQYLKEYMFDVRSIIKEGSTDQLFLSIYGFKLGSSKPLYDRLKYLQDSCNSDSIKEKDIGIHTLRHSVASHLFQNGMKLNYIQRFLGHSSRDSTSIYTHAKP